MCEERSLIESNNPSCPLSSDGLLLYYHSFVSALIEKIEENSGTKTSSYQRERLHLFAQATESEKAIKYINEATDILKNMFRDRSIKICPECKSFRLNLEIIQMAIIILFTVRISVFYIIRTLKLKIFFKGLFDIY